MEPPALDRDPWRLLRAVCHPETRTSREPHLDGDACPCPGNNGRFQINARARQPAGEVELGARPGREALETLAIKDSTLCVL